MALIATPRIQMQCRPQLAGETVVGDPDLTDVDHVPLTDELGQVITRVYARGTGSVELQESMFMSAGAPLIDFPETADHQHFRLLVDGGAITGMLTLSDVRGGPFTRYCLAC